MQVVECTLCPLRTALTNIITDIVSKHGDNTVHGVPERRHTLQIRSLLGEI